MKSIQCVDCELFYDKLVLLCTVETSVGNFWWYEAREFNNIYYLRDYKFRKNGYRKLTKQSTLISFHTDSKITLRTKNAYTCHDVKKLEMCSIFDFVGGESLSVLKFVTNFKNNLEIMKL